jgi:Sulfatase
VRTLAALAIAAAAVSICAKVRGSSVRRARWGTLVIGMAAALAAALTPSDRLANLLPGARGGTTPFRRKKATNWAGGFRVPTVIRWPGVIMPSTVSNDVFVREDFMPTFAAAGGYLDVLARCMKGCQSGNKTFKQQHGNLASGADFSVMRLAACEMGSPDTTDGDADQGHRKQIGCDVVALEVE